MVWCSNGSSAWAARLDERHVREETGRKHGRQLCKVAHQKHSAAAEWRQVIGRCSVKLPAPQHTCHLLHAATDDLQGTGAAGGHFVNHQQLYSPEQIDELVQAISHEITGCR